MRELATAVRQVRAFEASHKEATIRRVKIERVILYKYVRNIII
jgi:hypothetical protein